VIKELFLPTRIGSRRILSQRIIGIALEQNCVKLALSYAKSKKIIIEKLLEEKIADGSADTYNERAGTAIKTIVSQVGKYDILRVCIPASIVIFNELQLQFTDPEKIRMVLDYEIESILPFSVYEAITDFIITKSDKLQNTAQVLVAAVRSEDLQNQMDIYTAAGINPDNITIDLFGLYDLYTQIPEYTQLTNATALIKINSNTTRIAFLQEGRLRLTRYIPRGITTIIKQIAEQVKLSEEKVADLLQTYGIVGSGNDEFNKSAREHLTLLLNDIQFTLNSFGLKLNYYEGISKTLFVGNISAIKNFMTLCSDTLQLSCEEFDCQKILSNKMISTNKHSKKLLEGSSFVIALGTSVVSQEHSEFDLRRKQFAVLHKGRLIRQITTASILIIAILLTVGIKGYLDMNNLKKQYSLIEKRELNRIRLENILSKKMFDQKKTLSKIIAEAKKIVQEKDELWSAFAQQRMRPLDILLELTRIINKKQFDVTTREVIIARNDDTGEATVDIDGFFRSRTGGDHFTHFTELERRFKESPLLKIIGEVDPIASPEGGIDFTIKMKQKETNVSS